MTAALRLNDRLTSYWHLIRKDEVVPPFAQFNIAALGDIWNQCILFTVQPTAPGEPHSVSFYNVGEKVKPLYGNAANGSMTPANFQGANIVARVSEVISNPTPIFDEGQFMNERGKVVKYRSCLLPFGGPDRITHVIAGLSWREF